MPVNERNRRAELIQASFTGDTCIISLFDPNVKVETTDDIVENILTKIDEYEDLFECQFDETPSGYVFHVLEPRLLVSFGCRMDKRGGGFWDEILGVMGGEFSCILWSRNTRAIRWLQKNGMEITNELDNIKVLQLCQ
jgi:hypothetical protein